MDCIEYCNYHKNILNDYYKNRITEKMKNRDLSHCCVWGNSYPVSPTNKTGSSNLTALPSNTANLFRPCVHTKWLKCSNCWLHSKLERISTVVGLDDSSRPNSDDGMIWRLKCFSIVVLMASSSADVRTLPANSKYPTE